MSYSKEVLTALVKSILGETQVEALGLPRAVEESAIVLFLQESSNTTDLLMIREALVDLRQAGSFNFTPNGL